jgi:septal ring factor EnvC (AmiA/AmiB activator)
MSARPERPPTDIVERLRDALDPDGIAKEAADEIERLRAELVLTGEVVAQRGAEIERLQIVERDYRGMLHRANAIDEENERLRAESNPSSGPREFAERVVASRLREEIERLRAERDEWREKYEAERAAIMTPSKRRP